MNRSKSLMTGVTTTNKSLINPVSTSSQQELQFSREFIQSLNKIETDYVEKMATRKFLQIPNSVPAFLSLNDTMLTEISKQKNTNLKLLFQIARRRLGRRSQVENAFYGKCRTRYPSVGVAKEERRHSLGQKRSQSTRLYQWTVQHQQNFQIGSSLQLLHLFVRHARERCRFRCHQIISPYYTHEEVWTHLKIFINER